MFFHIFNGITPEKNQFLFSVQYYDEQSEQKLESIYLSDINGQTKTILKGLPFEELGYRSLKISPNVQMLAIQECGDYSIYCQETMVTHIQTGQKIYFKGYFEQFWINENQLLMIRAKDWHSTPADVIDISLVSFGEIREVTYYRLNIGEKSGLKRGDILSVYSNAKMNRVTGEDEGYDPKSLKGKLILVKVDQNSALAIKYVSNDVDLKSGYLVSDDQIQGKISGFEKSTEKY